MNRLKKKTIALVLASVVTVVGSFAAENYKNSLMGITFKNTSSGGVNMVLQTKTLYSGNLSLHRKDQNTYILTLPEVNNNNSVSPDLTKAPNIASVNVRTMPYSANTKGYTRITVKTLNPSLSLSASNELYIATAKPITPQLENNTNQVANNNYTDYNPSNYIDNNVEPSSNYQENSYDENNYNKTSNTTTSQNTVTNNTKTENLSDQNTNTKTTVTTTEVKKDYNNIQTDNSNNIYYFLWAILIVICSAYFYVKAKNKMLEISGESLDLNIDNEEKQEKKQKKESRRKKIASTIKHLDSTYPKKAAMTQIGAYPKSTLSEEEIVKVQEQEPEEELNIVDLDELFKETISDQDTSTNEEENIALEDFLSGFSFNEFAEDIPEEEPYDKEFYEKVLKTNSLTFSKQDLICIKKLTNIEILDETIRNIKEYVAPSTEKPISKEEILENLVTTYAINQNVKFSVEDINTLNKLISVELDRDFITDLTTNPMRVKEVERQILEYGDKPKKPSEIITLHVKDMLPDLSEALKLQSNREIKSEKVPDVVYYSKGYDVKILSISDQLPDLSKEINKKEAYEPKASASYDIVDNNYVVGDSVLNVSSALPDLTDVMNNMKKYQKPAPEPVIVDEKALMDSIANVQFKPFYDGQKFEILNEFGDETNVIDIDKELVEIEKNEKLLEIKKEKLLEEKKNEQIKQEKLAIEKTEVLDQSKSASVSTNTIKTETRHLSASEDLIKKIENTKQERDLRRERISQEKTLQRDSIAKKEQPVYTKRIFEGESYTIVSSVAFDENRGCHLAKNEKGYFVFGYIGDKTINLKFYESLKSERIQARLNEKLTSGTLVYLIRIGLQKFIINVEEDNIKHVMDLC